MNQDVNDPRVSEVYRDTATETAPASLNQSVLQEARQRATSGDRYARSIFWLRPAAWAATIGLCLAIVVELSDVPRPEPRVLEEIVVEAEQDSPQDLPAAEEASEMQRARKRVDEEGRVTLSDLLQLEKAESMTAEPAALGALAAELATPPPAVAVESPCDAEARTTPQSWLACIEGLEADGLNELAAGQREELHAAFPEFELP